MNPDKRDRQIAEAKALRKQGFTTQQLADKFEVHKRTIRRWLNRPDSVDEHIEHSPPREEVSLPELPRWDRPEQFESGLQSEVLDDDDEPVEDLLARRSDRFEALANRKQRRHIRTVQVGLRGPIAITHVGDPHVDDDGCNLPELIRTVKVISSTKGMWAGNIGDLTNNWVGRLQKLWAKQSTTAKEALRLAEWLMMSCPWLYLVMGNHDVWNHGDHILRYIVREAQIAVISDATARIELKFPKGNHIRIVARHDFKGSSIWNRAHGPMRESKLNPWGDVYVSGHRHIWAYHAEEGMDSVPRHAIIVRGFKQFDSYAETHGFYQHKYGSSCTTIFNPLAQSAMERVRVVWDIDEAADMLTWMRRRAGV